MHGKHIEGLSLNVGEDARPRYKIPPMSTARLYHEDAYLRRFVASVTAITRFGARAAVVLDRTAFYPEAGGQLGDRGQLAELEVIDTQQNEAGEVLHILGAEPPPIGAEVTGAIEWSRRRQHMAQHTAQHLRGAARRGAARRGASVPTRTRDRRASAKAHSR